MSAASSGIWFKHPGETLSYFGWWFWSHQRAHLPFPLAPLGVEDVPLGVLLVARLSST
jgi:hypothetical protein